MNKQKKIFVSGCYDMLHSGHVAFFEEAAALGDLYVGIGSDKTIFELKARRPFNDENERLYMVKSLKAVKDAWVNQGSGLIDYLDEIKRLQPDILFVNSDGHSELKENLCRELGIEYVVSQRIPHGNLPARSTTALRQECRIPYRIDLAGGWLDQPYVSKLFGGAVVTISIEPDYEFNDRSGMSTSSRKKAIELWKVDIPAGDREMLAKQLFCFENPPGSPYVSGSQDSFGIVLPGANRLFYDGEYLPSDIKKCTAPDVLDWIEEHLYLVPLFPRRGNYDVLANTYITAENVKNLADAAADCWDAILEKDLKKFGNAMTRSFAAQTAMFPNMVDDEILSIFEKYRENVAGYKISGAGGGGYMIFAGKEPVENSIKIRIRR
ncbi:MAG: adenylyltransferase/cytidyltransferase family protein [Dysgonamonadaceae bacterium]|jgi:cytidyltransferase-like protein|nr:adenylyltransferase/cytidyltransferase family protein [Dysgonamonadaceae bacterium]